MAVTAFNGDYITFSTVGTAGLTLYCRLRVTTYANYGDPVAINEGSGQAALEYDSSGNIYMVSSGGGTMSTGSSTAWFDFAITVGASPYAATAYYKSAGATSWTTLSTWTSASGAFVEVGAWSAWYPGQSGLGTHEISGLKIWNAVLTTSELVQESNQLTPVRWLNLRFWNPFITASTAHINQLPGGSDGTVTGTPADSTAQPDLAWKRQQPRNVIGGLSSQTLSPGTVAGSAGQPAPTVTVGSVTLSPGTISGSAAQPAPQVNLNLAPGAVDGAQSTPAPQADLNLAAPTIAGSAGLPAPSVSVGDVNLSPPAVDGVAGAPQPAVTTQNTLSPPVVDGAQSAPAPQVNLNLAPGAVDGAQSTPAPTVAFEGITLIPPVVDGAQGTPAPAVAPGAVTISPPAVGGVAGQPAPAVSGGENTHSYTPVPSDGEYTVADVETVPADAEYEAVPEPPDYGTVPD